MRILIITQRWYPDTFGGSELVAAEQARRLAKRGHEVTVLTEQVHNPPQPSLTLREGDQLVPPLRVRGGEPPEASLAKGGEGLRIYRYGTPQQFARMGGRSRTDVEEVRRSLREITNLRVREFTSTRKFNAAILHHPFAAYGFFKTGLRVPSLYVFHASTAQEVAFEGTCWPFLTPLFVWWVRRVELAVLRRADRIAVFSEFSRRVVEELAPEVKEKVVMLGVGVDLEKFKGEKGERGERRGYQILTVRRLTRRMGLLELVRAIKMVQEKLPRVHLTIVGEGPERGVLEREVARLGLQSCVTLAGRVAADELPRYYREADLFILPTQAYEGLGIATLEALASGLPVVGTPVGATPEVLGDLDPKIITKSASAPDIAQGILDFFARPEKEHLALRKKARELAEKKYNWDKAIDQLEESLALCVHKAKL